jgi:hypothetical protein
VRRFALAAGCTLGVAAALGFVLGAHLDALPHACPYRALTGRPCIFCGMSHAVAFAERGDLASASLAHPAWYVVLPLFALFVAAMATKRATLSWALVGAFLIGTLVR